MSIKILSDEEINKIFEIKRNSKNISLGELLDKVKKEITNFNYNEGSIKNRLILVAIEVSGNLKNNNPSLICPNCNSKYVLEYLYGDVFYRLFNGTRKQKLEERKKFDKMGLFINISPYGKEEEQNRYCCISCGNEW